MKLPLFVVILMSALLAACGHRPAPPPIIKTIEVQVPVPVYCNPNLGPEPAYVDNDEALAAAPDILSAMTLRIVGRLQRIDRDREKSAALDGCREPQL